MCLQIARRRKFASLQISGRVKEMILQNFGDPFRANFSL
jgi:hypothetical protein